MVSLTRPPRTYTDLVVNYLRSEVEKLRGVVSSIERTSNYRDDHTKKSIITAITRLRRIKKFIEMK